MSSFLEIIKDVFIPKDAKKKQTITNDDILAELEACFLKSFETQSMKGRKMLYDSNFLVLIHPDNYNEREQTLPFVVKEAINGFYDYIQKKNKDYGNNPHIPTTDSWYVQFSPTIKFDEYEIEKGALTVISHFASIKTNSGTSLGGSIRVTMKPKLSNVYETLNINTEALNNIDFVGRGAFRLKFDKNLGQIIELPLSEADGLATLTYSIAGKEYLYSMQEPEIVISKKTADGVYAPNTLVIDSDMLEERHARIKHDKNTNNFFIAVFASAKIDEKTAALSEGGDVQWIKLDKKSTILLGLFSIKFQNTLAI